MGGVLRGIVTGGALFLSGCSFSLNTKIPGSSSKNLQLQSEPAGALAQTSVGQSCQTPCELEIAADGDLTVNFTLEGFTPKSVPVKRKPKEAIFDSTAGFVPNPVLVQLEPVPAQPEKRKPKLARPHVDRSSPATAGPPAGSPSTPPFPQPGPAAPAAPQR